MDKQFKVSIIGAGYMATEHAKAFSGIDSVKLVGITSRSRNRAEQLARNYPDMRVFDDVNEMYINTQSDLVIVAVSEMAVLGIATKCFRHPWSILLEKPAGYNLQDAYNLSKAAHDCANRVYVALNRRAYSSTRQVLNRIKNIDGPRFIRILDQQDQSVARIDYNTPEEVVENYMFANSIHLIDLFRVFGRGKVIKVTPICPWTPKCPGVVVAKIEFSSGDVGFYEGVWNGPGPWSVTVVTPDETLEMRPLEQASVQLRGQRKLTQLEISQNDSLYKPGLRQQALDVICALKDQQSPIPKLDDSLKSMQLVAEIFELV